jgi:uncharacterized protein (DUF2141 family)
MSLVAGRSVTRSLSLAIAACAALLGAPGGAVAEAAPKEPAPPKTSKSTLVVEVSNLRNAKGRVAVAVFASEDAFPEQSRALRGKLASIRGGRAKVTFKGLKAGTYAIAVLHDENKNDKMDFNFLGMPLEGYGFSNNASAMFGPPSFEDASFRVKGKTTSKIRTKYFSL